MFYALERKKKKKVRNGLLLEIFHQVIFRFPTANKLPKVCTGRKTEVIANSP